MEKFQESRERAQKHIRTADHMLSITYPLVKDPKLLIAVTDNIFLSLSNAMASILNYDRLFKKIPPFQENFISMFNMFRQKSALHYKVGHYTNLIQDVHDIIELHKKSPIEFSRKDSYIICADDYDFKTISTNKLRDYIKETKDFIRAADIIVSKNERIFNKNQ